MKKKKTWIVLTVAFLFSLVLFVSIPLCVLFFVPPQYGATYYAELSDMTERLKTKEKKIVLIGNSSTAFGLNLAVMERSFPDYKICPFGLYGAVGTKAMLELAKPYLGEGDIVVISPEINEQAMSLYFSGEELLKCADGDLSLLSPFLMSEGGSILSKLPSYLTKKYEYFVNGAPKPDGVYQKGSFDENCQMVYERGYNVMPELYDTDSLIDFSVGLIDTSFVDYINEYDVACEKKGVTLYYNFCPVNRLAVTSDATGEEFFAKLNDSLSCPIIGALSNYVLDAEWFYDSNFHLNTLGSLRYSYQLASDLKPYLGIFSEVEMEEIEKPLPPTELEEGNNEDENCFLYEETGNGLKVVGLTEEGRTREKLTLPSSHDGKAVLSLGEKALQGDVFLTELRLPKGLRKIEDNAFMGCIRLEKIILSATTPVCTVGSHLLDGCQRATVYAPDYDSYLKYIVNYYWGQYASKISYLK